MKEYKQALTTLQLVVHFFIELAVSMAIGYFIGRKLDEWLLGDKYILTIIFIFLGLIGSLVKMFGRIIKMTGGKDGEDKKS
ncbi:MAG: AtpZ/AtpI family protein [Bacilli bacterium]|nr:AtpZ/AtpI family protein [Bacilli bacterium]MBN2696679.1 AtpZ/AtpI family protein [Bacilli bacterium]